MTTLLPALSAVLLLVGALFLQVRRLQRLPRSLMSAWREGADDFRALQARSFPWTGVRATADEVQPMSLGAWTDAVCPSLAGPLAFPHLNDALARQLTTRFDWSGEPPVRRALLCAMWHQGRGDIRACRVVLDALAWSSPAGLHGTAEALARDQVKAYPLMDVFMDAMAKRHAWSETALMGMLIIARRKAQLPTSDFGWLRHHDMPLFLALSSVGSRAFLPEALGAAVHLMAEVREGRGIETPCVGDGTRGILATEAHGYRDDRVLHGH